MRKFRFPLYSVFGAAFLVACGLILFPTGGRDDAYITYWAAYSLAKYGRVLNYNLMPVEQSSSLAQVVLIGTFARLFNLDVVLFGRISAILGALAVVFAVAYWLPKVGQKNVPLVILLLAANPFFIYWSFGGLETSLAAFGWLVFVVFQTLYLEQNQTGWLLAAGLLVLYIRPENALIVGLFSVTVLMIAVYRHFISTELLGTFHARRSPESRAGLLRAARLLLVNGVMTLVALGLRYAWFGDIFPQPVRAKTGGISGVLLAQGLQYLADTYLNLSMGPVMLACLVGMALLLYLFFVKKQVEPFLLNVAALLGIYLAFMLLTGGDWMEGGRFSVHVMPLICILAAYALAGIRRRPVFFVICVGMLALQLVGMYQFARAESTAIPAWKNISLAGVNLDGYDWFETHNVLALRDMPTIAALEDVLQKSLALKSPLVVMSGQMGMVPYYTAQKFPGQIIWLDRSGLADRVFTTCPDTAGWERETRGHLHFTYNTFMRYLPELQTKCAIPTPDIIFDLGLNIGQVADHGFTVVYSQTGSLNGGIGSQDHQMDVSQFIAINQKDVDLIRAAGTLPRELEVK